MGRALRLATLGVPVGGGGGDPRQFILREDFAAAPTTLTVVDTGSKLSYAGGMLVMAIGTTGDPRLYSAAISRAEGVTAACRIRYDTVLGQGPTFGWGTNTTDGGQGHWQKAYNKKLWYSFASAWIGGENVEWAAAASDTWYRFAVMLRSTGAVHFIDSGGGWQIMYVNFTRTDATPRAYLGQLTNVVNVDTVRVFRLPGDVGDAVPGNGYTNFTDWGLCAYYDATPAADDTAAGSADGYTEITWTPAAGETLDVMIRRTADDACFSIVCAESTAANGDTIKIIERNAGNTERASTAQAFAADTTYRIWITHIGATIKTHVGVTVCASYTSAAFNQTATGAKVSGFTAATHWANWPYALGETDAAALETMLE